VGQTKVQQQNMSSSISFSQMDAIQKSGWLLLCIIEQAQPSSTHQRSQKVKILRPHGSPAANWSEIQNLNRIASLGIDGTIRILR
jgi:hypothetical protein